MTEAQTLRMMKSLDAPHYDGAAHDLVADLRHRQHVPGHAGGDGLGRQDADPLSRQVVDGQPGRQALHLQAARRRAVLQRQEVHRRRRRLLLQAADQPRAQGAARLARRQPQGHPRDRPLHRRVRAGRAVLRPAAQPHHVHHGDPQQGERRGAGQGLRHQGGRRHRAVVLRIVAAAHRDRAQAPRRLQVGPLDVPEQGPGEVREALDQDRARGCEPRRRDDGRPVRRHPPDPAAVHPAGQGRAQPQRPGGDSPTSS